jgi:uncharacterized protein (TIGR02646 family)
VDCKGEVDHFRPKSRFPKRVYEWSNWVFACHDCNLSKLEKWPAGGYVDPCSIWSGRRAEDFFEFDVKTGEILAKRGLPTARRRKAMRMIEDLKLNAFHQLKRRLTWTSLVSKVLEGDDPDDPGHTGFLERICARTSQFSSMTRVFVAEQGYAVPEVGTK